MNRWGGLRLCGSLGSVKNEGGKYKGIWWSKHGDIRLRGKTLERTLVPQSIRFFVGGEGVNVHILIPTLKKEEGGQRGGEVFLPEVGEKK